MQYLMPTVLILTAIAVALAFVISTAMLFRLTKTQGKDQFWIGLIVLLSMIPVITDLRATRGSAEEGIVNTGWTPPGYVSFLSDWTSKAIIYSILTYALIQIVLCLKFRTGSKNPGSALYLSYIALVLPIFISAIAGTKPFFTQFLLFAPLIFTLVFLKKPEKTWQWFANIFRHIFLCYLILSGISGVILPKLTTSPALALLDGFDFRLNGIFSHSNTLAMAALGYLILDLAIKRTRTRYDYAGTVFGIAILLLTQSKTTIACALFSFVVMLMAQLRPVSSAKGTGFFSLGILTGIFLILPILIGLSIFATQYTNALGTSLDNQTFKALSTLTGRTNIWAITLDSWIENPIFGYGPDLWSMEYRLTNAPQYALVVGMAHNQVVQTLGESGLLGLLGLAVYCSVLFWCGIKFFKKTNGASMAFVGSFFIRGISETPFRHISIDVVFLMHLAFFIIFLSLFSENQQSQTLKMD